MVKRWCLLEIGGHHEKDGFHALLNLSADGLNIAIVHVEPLCLVRFLRFPWTIR